MLFSGDHIMQGSTVVISPPDGDMATYLDSLAKVRQLRLRSIAPGHGYLIDDPKPLVDWYIEHRLEREQQVLDALASAGTAKIDQLVATIYVDLDPELVPVAKRTVHAHLLKLAAEGKVVGKTAKGSWSIV